MNTFLSTRNPFVGNELDYFIRNEYYFNVHNIITKYNPNDSFYYTMALFNKDEIAKELYLNYCINYDNINILLEILPLCTTFMSQFPSGSKLMEMIIKNKEWYKLFSIYAISIGNHFISKYKIHFDAVIYQYNIICFNLAIRKLKRQKYVQNGIILKILMKHSGLFN